MREQSATRKELEAAIRDLVPSSLITKGSPSIPQNPLVAGAGLTGLLSGYAWGWMRGRARRAEKSR